MKVIGKALAAGDSYDPNVLIPIGVSFDFDEVLSDFTIEVDASTPINNLVVKLNEDGIISASSNLYVASTGDIESLDSLTRFDMTKPLSDYPAYFHPDYLNIIYVSNTNTFSNPFTMIDSAGLNGKIENFADLDPNSEKRYGVSSDQIPWNMLAPSQLTLVRRGNRLYLLDKNENLSEAPFLEGVAPEMLNELSNLLDSVLLEDTSSSSSYFDTESTHEVLFDAARTGDLDQLKLLILGGQYDLGTKDDDGRTIAFFAAEHNHLDVLMWMFDEDEQNATYLLKEVDIDGENVLGYSVLRDTPMAIIEYLVERGATFFPTMGTNGSLLSSVSLDTLRKLMVFDEIIEATMKKQEALIKACNKLSSDDEWLGNDEARERVEILLSEMSPEELNFIYEDQTPLITAIERYHFEVVRILIEHGARVDFADGKGRLPADVLPPEKEIDGIFRSPPSAVLRDLVDSIRGVDTVRFGELIQEVHPYTLVQVEGLTRTVINYLCMQEHEEALIMLDVLVAYYPTLVSGLNGSDTMFSTPLESAVTVGNVQMVRKLISAGANPRYKTGSMIVTPLEKALSGELWDCAKEIIKSPLLPLAQQADIMVSYLLKMSGRRADRASILSVFDVAYNTNPDIVSYPVQEKSGCVFTISDLFRGLMDPSLNRYRNIEGELRTTPYDLILLDQAIESNDTMSFDMILRKSPAGLKIPETDSDFDDLMLRKASVNHPVKAASMSPNPYYLKRLNEINIGSLYQGTTHTLEVLAANGSVANIQYIIDHQLLSVSGDVLLRAIEKSKTNQIRTMLYKAFMDRLDRVREAETLEEFQLAVDPDLMFVKMANAETMAEIIVQKRKPLMLRHVSSMKLDVDEGTLNSLLSLVGSQSLKDEVVLAFSRRIPVNIRWRNRIGNYTSGERLSLRISIRRSNDKETVDHLRRTPLMVAIDENDEVAFNALLDEGASIKNDVRSIHGRTVLMHFMLSKLPQTLLSRVVLNDCKESLEAEDNDGMTARDFDSEHNLSVYKGFCTEESLDPNEF